MGMRAADGWVSERLREGYIVVDCGSGDRGCRVESKVERRVGCRCHRFSSRLLVAVCSRCQCRERCQRLDVTRLHQALGTTSTRGEFELKKPTKKSRVQRSLAHLPCIAHDGGEIKEDPAVT